MATLLALPPELMRKVTDLLDPVDHVSLRSASKGLWATRDNLPRLNPDESVQYHVRYQRKTRLRLKKILSLVCTYCKRLRPRGRFDDTMRADKKRCRRYCITCGIYYYNLGKIRKDGKEQKACRGCYKTFPASTQVHWIPGKTVNHRGSALCHPCWKKLFRGRQRTPE